jgi:hypothetical protein
VRDFLRRCPQMTFRGASGDAVITSVLHQESISCKPSCSANLQTSTCTVRSEMSVLDLSCTCTMNFAKKKKKNRPPSLLYFSQSTLYLVSVPTKNIRCGPTHFELTTQIHSPLVPFGLQRRRPCGAAARRPPAEHQSTAIIFSKTSQEMYSDQ